MLLRTDDLPRWYVGTRDKYNKLAESKIDYNGIYFLIDTHEVILDKVTYTQAFSFFSGDKPSIPDKSKLYFSLDDSKIYGYNGTDWEVLLNPPNGYINPDGTIESGPITGENVDDYVYRILTQTTLDNCVLKIEYKEDENKLVLKKGELTKDIILTRLGNKLIRDTNSGTVYLLDKNDTVISEISMNKDRYTISGSYDKDKKALDLLMSDATHVYIDISLMFNLLPEINTKTITLSRIWSTDNTKVYLSMDVNVSSTPDNMLEILDDGLYLRKYMEKLGTGHDNEVLVSDNEDIVKSNGVTISTNIDDGDDPSDSKVVTEDIVSKYVTDEGFKDTTLKLSDSFTEADFIESYQMKTV